MCEEGPTEGPTRKLHRSLLLLPGSRLSHATMQLASIAPCQTQLVTRMACTIETTHFKAVRPLLPAAGRNDTDDLPRDAAPQSLLQIRQRTTSPMKA